MRLPRRRPGFLTPLPAGFAGRKKHRFRQTQTSSPTIDVSMRHKVTLLPGEGIGPEVAAATRQILDASGVLIDWEEIGARAENTDKHTTGSDVLNTEAIESVRRNRVALKGPMTTAIAGGARSVNVALRNSLDLYSNLGPVLKLPGD